MLMDKIKHLFGLLLFTSLLWAQPKALVITIDQAITPPVSEYLLAGLKEADAENYDVAIIEIDTPGGLYTTTRAIGQAILNSKVPVITYVSPQGARAASAGTFILYASHLAAMAPGTHLGSATPISVVPSSEEQKPQAAENKLMEDTRAYARSLAQYHGRNESFILSAVNEATSLTAIEALEEGAIEIIADSLSSLLSQADGQTVKLGNTRFSLSTQNASIEIFEPSLKQQILFTITDPNITYLLLMAGIYGLIIELFNPGSIVPGVIGAVCLLIASYSLHILPLNYAGLALIFLGVAFIITEAIIPSFGIFGFAGIISLGFGSFFLFDGINWAQPSIWAILSILLTLSLATIFIVRMMIKTHRSQPVSGLEGLAGKSATVIEVNGNNYAIRVSGEVWQAKSTHTLSIGDTVIISKFQGLTAIIIPQTGDT